MAPARASTNSLFYTTPRDATFQRNPLPVDWTAQREVVARFDA